MNTDENVFQSLLTGLTQDDKVDVLRSIEKTRELQIEQKRHPRRRRRRNEFGVLEPLSDESLSDESTEDEFSDDSMLEESEFSDAEH